MTENCKDCEDLIEKYGEENLNFCEFCEHYYHGKYCSCGEGQELKELEKQQKRYKPKVKVKLI